MSRIKEIRQANRLSMEEFAKSILVDCSTISRLEAGKTVLKEDQIERICKVYNVSADYILGHTDNKTRSNNLDWCSIAIYSEIDEMSEEDKEDVLKYIKFMKKTK